MIGRYQALSDELRWAGECADRDPGFLYGSYQDSVRPGRMNAIADRHRPTGRQSVRRTGHLLARSCVDRTASARVRREVLEWVAERDAVLMPAHFGWGRIAAEGSGFRYRPIPR